MHAFHRFAKRISQHFSSDFVLFLPFFGFHLLRVLVLRIVNFNNWWNVTGGYRNYVLHSYRRRHFRYIQNSMYENRTYYYFDFAFRPIRVRIQFLPFMDVCICSVSTLSSSSAAAAVAFCFHSMIQLVQVVSVCVCAAGLCISLKVIVYCTGSVNMPANCAIIPIWYREMHYICLSARALARLLLLHGSVSFVTGSVRMLMCVCCLVFSVPSQFNSQETCMRASTMISSLGNFFAEAQIAQTSNCVWERASACFYSRIAFAPFD